MAEIETAKLKSYVKIDFSTEDELELYIKMFEKEGKSFCLQPKEMGLLRWQIDSFGTKEVVLNYLRSLNTSTKTHSSKYKNHREMFLKIRRRSLVKLISKEPLLETSISSITTISLAAPCECNSLTF